jgi:hypothetical protein
VLKRYARGFRRSVCECLVDGEKVSSLAKEGGLIGREIS